MNRVGSSCIVLAVLSKSIKVLLDLVNKNPEHAAVPSFFVLGLNAK